MYNFTYRLEVRNSLPHRLEVLVTGVGVIVLREFNLTNYVDGNLIYRSLRVENGWNECF